MGDTKTKLAKLQIAEAMREALQTLAQEARDAKHVLAADAESAKTRNIDGTNDHDLIIEIKTVQQTMLAEIREMKDGTAQRIASLEACKLDAKDSYVSLYKTEHDKIHSDIETRTRSLEKMVTSIVAYGTIGIVILQAVIFLLNKYT